ERLADLLLVVVDDRVARGRLVAGEPQRVQRQRVGVGRRPLLLDQAAENADLDRVGIHRWKSSATPNAVSLPRARARAPSALAGDAVVVSVEVVRIGLQHAER